MGALIWTRTILARTFIASEPFLSGPNLIRLGTLALVLFLAATSQRWVHALAAGIAAGLFVLYVALYSFRFVS